MQNIDEDMRPYERIYKVFRGDNNYIYKGVKADLVLPTAANVSTGNTTDYMNWYIGFTDDNERQVEAGISYTKKFDGTKKFGKFFNVNGLTVLSDPLASQPALGSTINLRLENNNSIVKFYINDYLIFTRTCSIDPTTQVKLVHGTEGGNCTYTNAKFQNAYFKNGSGVWTAWSSCSENEKVIGTGTNVSEIYRVSDFNPMKTKAF